MKNFCPAFKIAVLILACTVLGNRLLAQEYELKLVVAPDQKFSYTTINDIIVSMNLMGQEIPVNTVTTFVYNQALREVTAGGDFVFDFSYTRIAMNVKSAMADFGFDTDEKIKRDSAGSEMFEKVLKPLLNRKFSVTITPTGKVSSISGLKELFDSLSVGIDANSAKVLSSITDEEKLKHSLENTYGYLPAARVKIGDQWTQKVKMDLNVSIDMEVTYTLKEVKGKSGLIDFTASFNSKNDNYEAAAGIVAKLGINGNMSGKCKLDISSGLFSEVKSDLSLKGTMDVQGTQLNMTGSGKSESRLSVQKKL